jgi:hypothetical protein
MEPSIWIAIVTVAKVEPQQIINYFYLLVT